MMTSSPQLRALIAAIAFGTIAAATAGCEVGLVGEPGPAYYDDYPPDAYVATTEPVYYEGRPVYWYRDRWYYREGRAWRHYEREPPALYQHRNAGPPVRHRYEEWHGRPAGRGNWRSNGRRR